MRGEEGGGKERGNRRRAGRRGVGRKQEKEGGDLSKEGKRTGEEDRRGEEEEEKRRQAAYVRLPSGQGGVSPGRTTL